MDKIKKNKEKKERETWVGYYPRKTKTKREKEISEARKNKYKEREMTNDY